MKNYLFIPLTIIFACFSQTLFAQTTAPKKIDINHFDEKAAREQALAKGMKPSEMEGYIQSLKSEFSSKKALSKETHKHTPYENAEHVNERVIYLNGDNKPMNIGCPNAGFENYDFTGWTGSTGTYSGTAASPVYALTPGIVNTAGNNTNLGNATNYQTVLSIPPSNPNYPNCVGYDSIACPTGGPLVSQIPFISPYSLDGVSCRMLGAFANYKVAKLKYIMSVTSTNKLFSYSYAIVLNDGHTGQPLTHQPYFNVTVKDQNGNPITGCQTYYQDATGAQTDTSFRKSHLTYGGNDVIYRPWRLVSIDLSSPIHASVTSISIEFEVAGCTAGGHLGYAYVDAECGAGGISSAFCSGTNAVLTAPAGYSNYQWYNNLGAPIAAPSGTNTSLTVSSPVVGDTYSVTMTTPGGCTVTLTETISVTNVSISNVNSAPSCAGGNSGIATVVPAGSNGVYSYTWTSLSTGLTVSNSQTATGLAAGNYSVLVSSPTCGQASANLSVGTSPPFFLSQSKPFCGNSTFIAQPNGSNYVWYQGSTLISGSVGTNDTLYINPAVAGDIYTVVYTNASGCRDSLKYTLSPIAGGNTYFSNTTNVCPSNSNGSTVINLNTPFSPPYSYMVTGPTAANVIANTSTTATSFTVNSLAPGTYTTVVNDGVCIYNDVVTIDVIQTNFTVTATNSVQCFPSPAMLDLDFGSAPPTSCGLDPVVCSGGSPTTLFATGTFTQNGTTNYPTPFGNWYTNGRTQFLVRKSDLNAAGITAGRISSLAFNILALNSSAVNYPDYSIKMGCTSLSALPNASSSSQAFIPNLQTVYSNANQPVSMGWMTHNFTQSYLWDGNSNIIIEVCFSFPNPTGFGNYTQNVSVQLKQMSYIANMYHVEDTDPVCGGIQQADNGFAGPMTNGENMLPNMKFGHCPYAQSASAYTVSLSSNGTIVTNYANDSIKVAPVSTTPPPNGSVVYTISVINPIGNCVGTRTVEVIYPIDSTIITTAITNSALCEGSSTNLSSTGALNYQWYYQQSAGGPLQAIASTSNITVTPPAVGTNTYIVIGNSPCPGSIPDTATIIVNVKPMANLIVTPLPDVTKCLNTSFVFNTATGSSTPINSGAPYTYSWTELPGNTPAPGVNTTSSYTTNSNVTTTLVVVVSGSCAIPTSDTVVVKNYVDDLAITISNSITTCPNKALTLNSNTSGGHAAYNYTWTVNSIPVANTPNLSYTSPSSGGTYAVSVSVMDSCSYQKTDNDVIVVLPNTLNISIVDSISLCGNTPFNLNSTSSGGYPNYSYQWFLVPDNNSISNTSGLSYTTPAAEGTYPVKVTITDSCGYQMSDIQIINVLPPCKVEIPNVITPNGDLANEYFKIKNLEYHPNTSVTIFDRWGLKVYENHNYNNEWKGDGVNDGTFFYVIDVPDDKKYSGFLTVFKGK